MTITTFATVITMLFFGYSPSTEVLNQQMGMSEASYIERIRIEKTQKETMAKQAKEVLFEEFKDIPSMVAVARCESGMRHYDGNGEVLRGEIDSRDIGIMQINEYYHGEKALEMGIDIFSPQGNILYAKYLYEHQGLSPWGASKPCWEKYY